MIYDLRHRTTYRYEAPVTYARCLLRLTPRTTERQTVLRHAITIHPTPSSRLERVGGFGEKTLTVVIDRPHRSLVIDARSKVELQAPLLPLPAESPPWEVVRELALDSDILGPESPASYLYPTSRTPVLPPITDYARASFPAGRPVIQGAVDLMTRIWREFSYDPTATEVSTPVIEAFNDRHGVCQDFAHVMICGLRGLGMPAAYVSGYVRTYPPPGRPRLQGADATHAWVRLWCGPTHGWVGFDPTNAVLAADEHLVLAIGRDYSDVAPIDGVILAPGDQELKVEVDVVPLDKHPGREGERVSA